MEIKDVEPPACTPHITTSAIGVIYKSPLPRIRVGWGFYKRRLGTSWVSSTLPAFCVRVRETRRKLGSPCKWASPGLHHCFDGEVVITAAGIVYEVSGIYGMAALPWDIPAKPPRWLATRGKSWLPLRIPLFPSQPRPVAAGLPPHLITYMKTLRLCSIVNGCGW